MDRRTIKNYSFTLLAVFLFSCGLVAFGQWATTCHNCHNTRIVTQSFTTDCAGVNDGIEYLNSQGFMQTQVFIWYDDKEQVCDVLGVKLQ